MVLRLDSIRWNDIINRSDSVVLGRLSSSLLMSMFQSVLKDLTDGPAKSVWVRQGLPPDDLQNLFLTPAPDPSVDSSLKLGTAAQV